jgi:hypothetical protein
VLLYELCTFISVGLLLYDICIFISVGLMLYDICIFISVGLMWYDICTFISVGLLLYDSFLEFTACVGGGCDKTILLYLNNCYIVFLNVPKQSDSH